jgi:predicted DNA-binding transcriptional regulator AlpA
MNEPRCYTTAQVLARLEMNRRTFFELKRRGRLPFLEELRPRLGRIVRYRADRIDQYLAGKFQPVLVKRGA